MYRLTGKLTISVGKNGDVASIYNVVRMQKNKVKFSLEAQGLSGKTAFENFTNDKVSQKSNTVNTQFMQDGKKDTRQMLLGDEKTAEIMKLLNEKYGSIKESILQQIEGYKQQSHRFLDGLLFVKIYMNADRHDILPLSIFHK